MKFTIARRWFSSLPPLEVEIDASLETAPYGVKLGAAIKVALETRADLTRADLTRAVLTGAVLTDADLTGADLTGADLTRADLTRADLTDAVLTDADLTDADLTRADLTGADLRSFKADLWMTLTQNRAEVPALVAALREGRVDGSTYSGECACLVGTIANAKAVNYADLVHNPDHPAERWFAMIKQSDRPGDETGGGVAAKLALEWTLEWCVLSGVEIDDGSGQLGAAS